MKKFKTIAVIILVCIMCLIPFGGIINTYAEGEELPEHSHEENTYEGQIHQEDSHEGQVHEEQSHEGHSHGNYVPPDADEEIVYRIDNNGIEPSAIEEIEHFVNEQIKIGKIPGISIAIVNGENQLYNKGFGYKNLGSKDPVTKDTLFEIGSMSKAFTALGILKLEGEGKIDLNDPVSKYIPWLHMKYNGEEVDVTIEQFLHQTTGVPFETTCEIPVSGSENALEETVKTLIDQDLLFKPGEYFFYASLNYDVLGLVIQKVSGMPYEDYMRNNVLKPLGLKNTCMSRKEGVENGMSHGYKIGFTGTLRYDAPEYRGNTPAGYIISNTEDMSRWLGIQMESIIVSPLEETIIHKSHIANTYVPPAEDGSFYAAGWATWNSIEYFHDGGNPNFSSFISFRPEDKIGIVVLANRNTVYTRAIAQGVLNIVSGKEAVNTHDDNFVSIDKTASVIVLVSAVVLILTICFIVLAIIGIIKRKRSFKGSIKKKVFVLIPTLGIIICFGYCLYKAPDILFGGMPWSFIDVWGPMSVLPAAYSLFAAVGMFCAYIILVAFFPKSDDKSYFMLTFLSIASGLGNALIIFAVNSALNSFNGTFQTGLFIYFVLGIIIYVFGQRLIRSKLIIITNNIVYSKRIELVDKILKSSYQGFESIENGEIQAGLNNDTETVSNFANTFITGITSLVTLITCFIYLAFINVSGMLVSMMVIALAGVLYFIVGGSANRIWEQTRDIQNVFFKFLNDLTGGFKELNLNLSKQKEFRNDLVESCEAYRQKRIKADIKFTNVFVMGELLFVFVIGIVAYIFPVTFDGISRASLITFVFVFLYMTGPVRAILNTIPNLIQMRVSYKRINELIGKVSSMDKKDSECKETADYEKDFRIELADVEFKYKVNGEETFSVGPVNCEFNSGEITFITGGNGSGKSTLAKLITGLYKPDAGEIKVNGKRKNSLELAQQNTAVFSDFYLFDKLYGIDYKDKSSEIEEWLKVLKIEDKVQIADGKFSTVKLSTGQRKRLALLVSILENRPVCVFDEWAADQDPAFREYFYNSLLQELKKRGKCVIAITHDDRYFGLADKIIKMELGKVVKEEIHDENLPA